MRSQPTASRWLSRLLRQLARRAAADAKRLDSDHDRAVHALRVRMKKLRAVLRLASDDPAADGLLPLIKRARAIKDGVAGSRDIWVTERLAMKIGGGLIPLSPLPAKPEWTAKKTVNQTLQLLSDFRGLRLPPQSWAIFFHRYAESCRRARKALKRCLHSHAAEDFHRWRLRVKTCCFQGLALHRWLRADKRIQQLGELGSRLGKEHDLVMLLARIPEVEQAARWREQIEKKRRQLHRQLRREGKKILGDKPAKTEKKLLRSAPK